MSQSTKLPKGLALSNSPNAFGILSLKDLKDRILDVVESGDLDELRKYICLSVNGFTINSRVKDGETCLHIAVRRGFVDCVEYLIKQKANLKEKSVLFDRQAIHLAVLDRHINVLRVLLQGGADCCVQDKLGATPLFYAANAGSVDMVTLLVEGNRRRADGLTGIRARYVDIGAKERHGNTPVLAAAQNGHADVIRLLVQYNCHLDQRNSLGWTVVHAACQANSSEALTTLLEVRPSMLSLIHCRSTVSWCLPIHVACRFGCLDTVLELIKRGSLVNEKTKEGFTPLMEVIESYGSCACVNALLDAGAKPDILNNKSNKTVLIMAIERVHLQAIWLLLNYGANMELPCHQRKNARETATAGLAKTIRKNGTIREVGWWKEIIDALDYFNGRMRTLQELCRISIRKAVGVKKLEDINSLPLPTFLRVYVRDMRYRTPPEYH